MDADQRSMRSDKRQRSNAGHAKPLPRRGLLAFALLPLLLTPTAPAAGAPRSSPALKTMVDFRDEHLVRQRFDYSCGAAALATLLRYGWDDAVTEQTIIGDLLDQLSAEDLETRRKEGFSLYDLQQVAQKRGYKAQGFRLAPENLLRLKGPVIVFLETMGYKHFAVLKGVRGDRVYLADPARGNIRLPAYRFLDSWMKGADGIVFVVEPAGKQPAGPSLLSVPNDGPVQPEILGTRELLAIGPSLARMN